MYLFDTKSKELKIKKLTYNYKKTSQGHLKILWQGWHNTGQKRPYFHYGPLGKYSEQRWT